MAGTFGRDKLWTAETWAGIDAAVMAEVGRLRVAQKVFEAQPETGPNVSADILVGGNVLGMQEGLTLPFIEIWTEFMLTKGQVDNEATLHTARRLAALAARSVALSEDVIVFQGGNAGIPATANNAGATLGLLNLQNVPTINVNHAPANQAPANWGSNIFDGVAAAITMLVANGHSGPYALFLPPLVQADSLVTLGTNTTTFDRLSALVEGRVQVTAALPVNPIVGLVVSLGGNPTTLHVAQDVITAFTQEDQQGGYRFRVFERVQLVARETAAFVRLLFQNPAAGGGRRNAP